MARKRMTPEERRRYEEQKARWAEEDKRSAKWSRAANSVCTSGTGTSPAAVRGFDA